MAKSHHPSKAVPQDAPPEADELIKTLWRIWRNSELSVTAFAKTVGVPQSTMCRYLSGIAEPVPSVLRQIFRTFGWDIAAVARDGGAK